MGEIRYLARDEVGGLLPSPADQVELVRSTLHAMRIGECQLPPKPAIHPRADTFIHAMPAYVEGCDAAVVKWIGGSLANKSRGLPYLSGVIVVNNAETAAPIAIMDASEITAARTAAVTAVCIERFAVPDWKKVTIIGFGVQGKAHARLLTQINKNVEIIVAGSVSAAVDGGERVRAVTNIAAAVAEADVVITAIRLERPAKPFVEASWVHDGQLVAPIDFDASIRPALASSTDAFIVDDIGTFSHYQGRGYFTGWGTPVLSLADVFASDLKPRLTLCCNLGVATLDAVFAQAVLTSAERTNSGVILH